MVVISCLVPRTCVGVPLFDNRWYIPRTTTITTKTIITNEPVTTMILQITSQLTTANGSRAPNRKRAQYNEIDAETADPLPTQCCAFLCRGFRA
mmetsp:Transcript_3325/g.7357  ORF Transcript_3325/g.7357 Transcript_3325/m.7357 type:complete len:94 (+) Transcript_3325:36-317(+)